MSVHRTVRPRPAFGISLGVIAIFGMVLASAELGWSLRNDEPYTANTVHRSWLGMWGALRSDSIFPLHFLLLWVWRRAFGESEIALRMPSLLSYGATIVVVGCTARRAADARTGLLAALLVVLSTGMGQAHAAFARPYALLGLMVALATHVTLTILQVFPTRASPGFPSKHSRRGHVLLIVLHTLGLLTHPLYVFAMLALTVAALWVEWRAAAILLVDCAAASGLFLLAVGQTLAQTLGLPTTAWMPIPDLKDLADGFLNLWGHRRTLLILAYLLALGVWRGRGALATLPRPITPVCLTVLALTSLVPFLVSQFKPVYVETRAPIMFLPIACVLVALLIGQLDNRFVTVGVLTPLVAVSIFSAYRDWTGPDPIPARAALHHVVERARCGDVFVLNSLSLSETEYYFRRFNAPACLKLETFPLDTITHPGWLDGPGLFTHLDRLEGEARGSAERLAVTAKRVWLFLDSRLYPEIGDVIRRELDSQLTPRERLGLRGSFFDSILIYSS